MRSFEVSTRIPRAVGGRRRRFAPRRPDFRRGEAGRARSGRRIGRRIGRRTGRRTGTGGWSGVVAAFPVVLFVLFSVVSVPARAVVSVPSHPGGSFSGVVGSEVASAPSVRTEIASAPAAPVASVAPSSVVPGSPGVAGGAYASVPPGVPKPLATLSGAHTDKMVTVVGRISSKLAPATATGRAPHRWYATDGTGVVLIVLFPDLFNRLVAPDTRHPVGGLIQVRGKVTVFRGQLQLSPSTAGDVQAASPDSPTGIWGLGEGEGARAAVVAPGTEAAALSPAAPPAPPTPVPTPILPPVPPDGFLYPGAVGSEALNTTVRLAGRVSNFRPAWSETAPSVLTLEGGGGALDVVFWSDVARALGPRGEALARPGVFVQLEGTLSEFRDRLQVRLQDPERLIEWAVPVPSPVAAVVAPEIDAAAVPGIDAAAAPGTESGVSTALAEAAPGAPPAASLPPGVESSTPSRVARGDVGKRLAVRGIVRAVHRPHTERAPTRIELADDTASLTVVFWQDRAEQFLGVGAPVAGRPWGVIGQVAEYRGELQLRAETPLAD